MSHIKTYDVEPSVDAVPIRVSLSQRKRLPREDGAVTAALSSLNFTDEMDLVTAAQKLWSLRRQDLLTPDEQERALYRLEVRAGLDVRGCESCEVRRAIKWHLDAWVCDPCYRDSVDRGWNDYKDRA